MSVVDGIMDKHPGPSDRLAGLAGLVSALGGTAEVGEGTLALSPPRIASGSQ